MDGVGEWFVVGNGEERRGFGLVGSVDRRRAGPVHRRLHQDISWPVRLIETGYTQNYALVMILGVLIFVGYVLWGTP